MRADVKEEIWRRKTWKAVEKKMIGYRAIAERSKEQDL